jgi:predicted DNA-binding protein
MKRTTVFVEERLEAELRALSARRGKPVASLVREAVEAYVASQRDEAAPALRFQAAGRSGRRDVAERHEDLLWRAPHEPATRPAPARRPATRRPR